MNLLKFWILVISVAGVPIHAAEKSDFFIIQDFNSEDYVNQVGGKMGKWELDPNDKSQWCNISLSPNDAIRTESGASLRIDYNIKINIESHVTGTNFKEAYVPADNFNGIYMFLNRFNAQPYRYLCFFAKGDAQEGFTRSFKVELKDGQRSAPVFLEGLTDSWKAFYFPLSDFSSTINLSTLTEFVIVFDNNVTRKLGTIYLDKIGFSKNKKVHRTG